MTILTLVAATTIVTAQQTKPEPQPSPNPPKNAIRLFDGRNTDEWVHPKGKTACTWEIVEKAMVVKAGSESIMTKREFGDYRLHLEFWLPLMADQKDQGKANSGVYNQGRYEIQILDSFENKTYPFGGCGAIYGQKDPDVDAIIPPEQWNTYDIWFKAPRFDKAGKVTAKPRVTVYHNGKKIHNDVEIEKDATTAALEGPQPAKGPILLQNHGCPIRFRNIWIVPMDTKP